MNVIKHRLEVYSNNEIEHTIVVQYVNEILNLTDGICNISNKLDTDLSFIIELDSRYTLTDIYHSLLDIILMKCLDVVLIMEYVDYENNTMRTISNI